MGAKTWMTDFRWFDWPGVAQWPRRPSNKTDGSGAQSHHPKPQGWEAGPCGADTTPAPMLEAQT